MNGFIEVTGKNGAKKMINTTWIERVAPQEDGCIIVMQTREREIIICKESYKAVKRMLTEEKLKEQEWIPVEDKMPERQAYVLVTRLTEGGEKEYDIAYRFSSGGLLCDKTEIYGDKILAWMELPDLYGEEKMDGETWCYMSDGKVMLREEKQEGEK